MYNTEDAQEALLTAKKWLDKFSQVLGDLDQMSVKKFVSILRSMPNNQGMKQIL